MNIVELDHECKIERNRVRRLRCKLRKRLMSSFSDSFVVDIYEIIIDYCMINRSVIDILRKFSLEDGPEYADIKVSLGCIKWSMKDWSIQHLLITTKFNEDKWIGIPGIKNVVNIMNDRYQYESENNVIVRDQLIAYINRYVDESRNISS